MIDHLLFNAHKFYPINDNADKIDTSSRNYVAVPKSFTIPAGNTLADNTLAKANGGIQDDMENVSCIGISDDVYYFARFVTFQTGGTTNFTQENPGAVYKKDVKDLVWK